MIFVLRITSGPRVKFVDSKKHIFKPPVVYATDRSKAVVPVLFLILCSFVVYTTGRLVF